MRPTFAALVLLLVAGCTTPAPVTAPAAVVVSPTSRPAPSTSTPTTVPSPTPRVCLSRPGRIVTDEIQAEGMSRSLPYRVYLPPCFDDDGATAYPVLILIHGLQASDSQWDELGVNETADALIREGGLPPAVIVMPWERKGLDFQSAIVDVLLPHIESAYAGKLERRTTAIGGVSRGAGWALRIGLQRPYLFGAIGLHSPAVLAPDMYFVADWIRAARQSSTMPRLWIDIAERDTSRVGAQELASLLDSLDVRYAWSSAPGEHSAPYWSSRVADYLRWYGEDWPTEAATARP